MDPRKAFGDAGERIAAAFLEAAGMRVLERQVRTAYGEIDLVVEDGDELAFVEVKTRQSMEYGYPEEAVTAAKFRHMAAAADVLLSDRGWDARLWRLDVVAIRLLPGQDPEIVHLRAVDRPNG